MKAHCCFLILCIIGICQTYVRAQSNFIISGRVLNEIGQPLDEAVVSLLSSGDSTLVKVIVTNASGLYEFTLTKTDNFFLSISHTGFKTYNSKILVFETDNTLKIPPVQLSVSDATQLKQVNVISTIPFVEKKADRVIVNPDALITNAGLTVLEVLEKSPGVSVNADGIISLNGRQGVTVFIDDKPVYLQQADLANYLKSLPSGSISVIEIMTNPPAKYDAAGNAGVINIKLKKSIAKGFNGSLGLSYGQGIYARSNNSLNVNYRINKINIFSSISYTINNSYQDLTIKRKYFNAKGELNSTFDQRTLIGMKNDNLAVKAGLDYYASKKSTYGLICSGFLNNSYNTIDNTAWIRNAELQLQNRVEAYKPSHRKFKNESLNFNYLYKVDTLGKELSCNFDYSKYTSGLTQSLLSETFLPDNTFVNKSNLISDLPAGIQIKTAKLDYTHPLQKGIKLDAGIKSSFINTNNEAKFFDKDENGQTVNNDFSNNFKYHENIYAAYINGTCDFRRMSLQAGLRFENTAIEGLQYGNELHNDSSFKVNYNNLFPTLYITYKLDSGNINQVGFSAGRRIDRPNYQDMNPFTYPLDRFTLYAGNPFLKPTFSANFELSHTYKNLLTTTLMYSYIKDVITETIEQNTAIFYSRPGNIGKQTSYGISINGNTALTKWMSAQLYTELMYNNYRAVLYDQELNNSGWYAYIGPALQFQFAQTWSAECSGNYQTSIVSSQFVLTPVGSVRIGIGKKIFKNKGTVKLSCSDVFYTNQPGGEIQNLYNSTAGWHSYLDTRVFTLSFNYRFNKGKGLNPRLGNEVDSEKSRVK